MEMATEHESRLYLFDKLSIALVPYRLLVDLVLFGVMGRTVEEAALLLSVISGSGAIWSSKSWSIKEKPPPPWPKKQ